MPDWTYQPFFKPLLFRFSPERARDLTLGAFGTLGNLPFGPAVIRAFGHSYPPASLGREVAGVFFPGPVGLGAGLDIRADATRALAQLGFVFIEVGPVTLFTHTTPGRQFRLEEARTLARPDSLSSIGAEALADRLKRISPLGRPVIVRLAHAPGVDHQAATREVCLVASRLACYASIFTLEVRSIIRRNGWTPNEWIEFVVTVADGLRNIATPRPLFLCLPPDSDGYDLDMLLPPAIERGIAGVLVAGGRRADDHVLFGAPTRDASLRLVEQIRFRWGDRLAIIGSGGIIEPVDAVRFIDAGASLVQVHSGLVYSGPGLPKRINEAIAFQNGISDSSASSPMVSLRKIGTWPSWVWFTLFSIVMIVGGLLVSIAGATRIVFPYDEAFVGLSCAEISPINDRLLPFMMHDRVTLGAALVALGVIYYQLATRAARLGFGWAPRVIWVSSIPGFASFFLFLGHGYFDPLHAAFTVVVVPLFILGLIARAPREHNPVPDLFSDWRWFRGLCAQFLLVMIGIGFAFAGLTIGIVGIVNVFVPEDLAYLGTTRNVIEAANLRLIPLIAHDRAALSGPLNSFGLAIALTAMWGFRPGASWLWWTFATAGVIGFAGAIGIHILTGYVDTWHLAPVAIAALGHSIALSLARPYLIVTVVPGESNAAPIIRVQPEEFNMLSEN